MEGDARDSRGYLTRYEVIAIAVPGAAMLLGLWYVSPSLLHGLEPKDASVGTLGIFTIAAFCVGHILQVFTIIAERLIAKFLGEPSDKAFKELPDNIRRRLPNKMVDLLGLSQEETARASYRDYFFQITALIRSRGDAEMFDVFTLARGFHKELAAAFLVVLVAALWYRLWSVAVVTGAIFVAAVYMTHHYSKRYSKQMWLQFVNLESDSTGTEAN